MPSPALSVTSAGAETVKGPGPLPVASMPVKAYADGAVSTTPPRANPAARATNEALSVNVPPSCLFLRFVGEVNEFVSGNLRPMVNNLLLLK